MNRDLYSLAINYLAASCQGINKEFLIIPTQGSGNSTNAFSSDEAERKGGLKFRVQ